VSVKDELSEKENKSSLFVKGFGSLNWSHLDLHQAFKKFGSIVSSKVSIDKDHKSKGFGYITFEKEDDALKAREEMDSLEVEGATLSVSVYQKIEFKKGASTQGMTGKFNNLYVKTFPTPDFSD
jgi:RNA recognition motif-containing protein